MGCNADRMQHGGRLPGHPATILFDIEDGRKTPIAL
jgi:hypothetical protein